MGRKATHLRISKEMPRLPRATTSIEKKIRGRTIVATTALVPETLTVQITTVAKTIKIGDKTRTTAPKTAASRTCDDNAVAKL